MSENIRDITTVIDRHDLLEFPHKISNLIKLNHKNITPRIQPRIIFYCHPARSELLPLIEAAARYYDLPVISLEKTLLDQREKLKKLGCVSHDVLTRRAQIPDDVGLLFNSQIATAFMQHEVKKTVCQTKGWAMVNYPMSTAQFNQFMKMKNDPVLVFLRFNPGALPRRDTRESSSDVGRSRDR